MARPSLRNVAFDHGPTVTRMFAAFNGRNLDDWMADASEDVEVESRFSSVGHTTFRGRDGVVSWWDDLAEAWDPIRYAEFRADWYKPGTRSRPSSKAVGMRARTKPSS